MCSSRGRLHSMKIDMKSPSSTLKQERQPASTLMQAGRVKVDFVPYLPIRNQLLTQTIRKVEDGGRKWDRARANPIDKYRDPSIRIGIYSVSWNSRLLEASGMLLREVLEGFRRYKHYSVVQLQEWSTLDQILEDFWLPKWGKFGEKTAKKRGIWG